MKGMSDKREALVITRKAIPQSRGTIPTNLAQIDFMVKERTHADYARIGHNGEIMRFSFVYIKIKKFTSKF